MHYGSHKKPSLKVSDVGGLKLKKYAECFEMKFLSSLMSPRQPPIGYSNLRVFK